MSAFSALAARIDDASTRTFGTTVTYTAPAGVSEEVSIVLDTPIEMEEAARGSLLEGFVRVAALTDPPVAGDAVAFETASGFDVRYRVIDVNSDTEGGARLTLQKVT